MRDAAEVVEEIIAVCYAYENRERSPFIGTVQLLEDLVARRLLEIRLAPLMEEFSKKLFVSCFSQCMEGPK